MISIFAKKTENMLKLSCIASSSASSRSKSSQVLLKVIYKPEVTITQTSKVEGGKPGDNLQFRCNTQAIPEVTSIEWFLNESKLPEWRGNILMLEVSPDLNGASVKFQAKNLVGVAEETMKIQLKCE